jgi:hypothetical protein
VPKSGKYGIKPKQNRYNCPGTDEFRTYAGKKENTAYLRLSSRYGGNSRVCAGKTRLENGVKAEKSDKTPGNNLLP